MFPREDKDELLLVRWRLPRSHLIGFLEYISALKYLCAERKAHIFLLFNHETKYIFYCARHR
jgi:hypothetical protein